MMLLAVPVLPLIAALAALGVGRRLPYGGGELILGAVALSLLVLVFVPSGAGPSATWFESGGYRLTVGLEVTPLTWFVASIVAGVSLCVGIYSLGYMAEKTDRPRFFAEMGLFVGAMLLLVLSSSLVLLFAAWELVGLASYLLIGFHYAQTGASRAAAKAFLMTRIGDVGLLLGWLLALAATGSTDIAGLLDAVRGGQLGSTPLNLMALLMLAGAIGKSAQLPLTGWLPDAMIGPSPVSALLHSATMVAAGVFLILRLYPMFEAAPVALSVLFWIGAATALIAGLIATGETDLKRVLAWSTASQLGEMMIALGLGGPLAASFHLAAHAAFKSTLFLAAGAVQEQAGTRELDRLGGLIRALPLTGASFVGAALALAGVPPFSGYWSEETILAVASRHGPAPALLIVLLILVAGVYIGRAATATFLGSRRRARHIDEPAWTMRAGMGLLALAAAGLGWILADRLGTLLAFPWLAEPETAWRALGIAASVAGLAFGGFRVRHGIVPAFGTFPERLGAALNSGTEAPAVWTIRLAGCVEPLEAALDKAGRGLARVASALAGKAHVTEGGFDLAARWTAEQTSRVAIATERAEAGGFGTGGDRLAAGIASGGEQLRVLQAGQLYFYTLALFVWVAAALALAGFMLWL